jgi:hypothetical protein
MKRAALQLSAFMLLAGCAAAPVSAPGPILPKGPLHGRLEQGIYHDMHDWFGVGTPVAPTEPGYGTLSLDEEYQPNISYVSFIPTDAPGEFYRVYVEDFWASNHPVTGYDQIADSAMAFFGKQVTESRSEPIQLIDERPWHTATTSGLLRFYTERAPIEPLLNNLAMAEDYTAYILVYVTADKGKVAVLWMEWPVDCKYCAPVTPGPATTLADPVDKAFVANARVGTFMGSFRYGKD